MRACTAVLLVSNAAAMIAGCSAMGSAQSSTRTELAVDAAPVWFEESGSTVRVSPDGRWAAYRGLPFRLYDLKTGRETREPIWAGLDVVQWIAFGADGEVFLRGRLGSQAGWFRRGPSGPIRLPVPPDADPQWSADGSRVAYFRSGAADSGVFAGTLDHVRSYPLGGAVTGLAWTPSLDTLVAATTDRATGVSALYEIELIGGHVTEIVGDLDAVPGRAVSIAVAPDGRRAFVALAGDHRPVDAERHHPHAARRMSIYEIDLSNGRKRVVAAAGPGADLLAPAIANGRLYWTRAETRASVATLLTAGGPVHALVGDAAVPSWRPDGKQIGFYYGDWRVADWAINWDAGVIPVDGRGVADGPRAPLITNYGEDFEPEWSPRGKWIAYHSHRSPNPVPYYGATGSTDDIWLRRVGAPPRDTADIRLSDFGFEAGPPSWSRDGARVIFVSYDRNGTPGQNLLWLVTIDTATGMPLGHSRVSLPAGVQSVAWAAWSPVSDDIAIEAESTTPDRHALLVMAPDGSRPRRLVEFPMQTYGGVAWTPDGKTLIYSALAGKYDQLFAVDVAGGTPRRLTHESAQMLHPRVSPTGLVIAATRLEHRKTVVSASLPR